MNHLTSKIAIKGNLKGLLRWTKWFLIALCAGLLAFTLTVSCRATSATNGIQENSIPPRYILVDQFGYRPNDRKMAVISQPCFLHTDLEEAERLTDAYSLIEISGNTEKIVYEAIPTLWNNGEIHNQSGDCAAWFDFSETQDVGRYIIQNNRTKETSWPFYIRPDIYREILVAATRMFFYQRSGFPKHAPYADPRWTDDAAFIGPRQDTEARFVEDRQNTALTRDMQGGWFDAGDTNKYVTFASTAVHQLLDAYQQNPTLWTDDFNIPESGNGIPDLLDEVRYEIEWLKRMQADDGGAFIKIGTVDFRTFERPSLDPRPRFYAPQCSSATIDIASMFSHAALVFKSVQPLSGDVEDLQNRSIKAWHWYHSHPHQTDCDTQVVKSGDADRTLEQQADSAIAAAIYLSRITSDPSYENYLTENLRHYCFYCHQTWYPYKPILGDALLYYVQQPDVSQTLKSRVIKALENLTRHSKTYGLHPEVTPYPAHMPDDQYHWGSNFVQAVYGITNFDAYRILEPSTLRSQYYDRALEAIHYFHGVNPLGLVYLSNMYAYGASHSANEMYHEWFGHGIYDNALTSESGPASGYLTGGPNKNYTGDAPINLDYPMRAYLDSNNKRHSMYIWELTEPGIYYQSAYLKLLSRFVSLAQ
ncbi:glycosyl hydrolase 9 family protein [Leptolyngbya sp. BL0902]|uniref:glycoside hydrolase family 9 protein n=1 Tax=Leptolyngbya sp. BL0902 TaxID=1115757 RepID=UPI0018E857FB|nr:glycoside hydrolase family 9 protein [Leptolyngbya sp. BL0902]QQE66169.1 glycosyl hydrolase 9 family protein [Leptolyngbya sp. BL0902]